MDHAHEPHLALLPVDAAGNVPLATHVATRAGDWFDPGTWAGGQVPGDGAIVHIPAGVSVSYEGASDAKLFMVRVDGTLSMTATNGAATKMVVDTVITSASSLLHVDADGPSDGTVDIVFAEGTPVAHQGHFSDHSAGDGVLGRYSWDPEQLSLGLVASGEVKVEGQTVEGHLQFAEGPMAGESHISFHTGLAGIETWKPGHQIVVGGTSYNGRDGDGHLISGDEVRTITQIKSVGGKVVVTLDRPLEFDHVGPQDPSTGAELTGYAANLTRNVNLSSAVADQNGDGLMDRGVSIGEQLGPNDHHVTERGHVMMMHNDNALISNSGFLGLGRTDKSIGIDDFVLEQNANHNHRLHHDANGDGIYDPETDHAIEMPADLILNQRGRYPIHIHMAGTGDDHEDHGDHHGGHTTSTMTHAGRPLPGPGVIGPCAATGNPICHCGDADGDGLADCLETEFEAPGGAVLQGNVVWGSPGWGFVHHSSEADMIGNVAFDVAGSSFVAESGDEVGSWTDNIAINSYGARPGQSNEDSDDFNEDDGFQGVGFYLKSRILDVEDNVAVSSARAGFFYHNNGVGLQETPVSELGDIALAAPGLESMETENVPIASFDGNRVIGAFEGIRIATDPTDAIRKYNDAYSTMTDFIGYGLEESGVSVTYSSKYVFADFLLIGNDERGYNSTTSGFFFKASAADMTVRDSHVEGFDSGVYNWSQVGDRQEYRRGFWDPKLPKYKEGIENYEGLDTPGITNPAHNLWNTNVINLTTDNLEGRAVRAPRLSIADENGIVTKHSSVAEFDTSDSNVQNDPAAQFEFKIGLVGDSAAGALVALWREDLATDPDQQTVLQNHVPLAYNEDVYLGQVYLDTGLEKRNTYLEVHENINADYWSGTVLEFAKTDSLGTQVFEYGDFTPMDPGAFSRQVTTNERIVFTKEMIDGVLNSTGYYTLPGYPDAKFVEMSMIFSDRGTGEWHVKTFLVALDLAWQIPADALNLGTVRAFGDLIIAPEYAFFENGVLVPGRAPVTGTEIQQISHQYSDLLAETQIFGQVLTEDGGIGVISSEGPPPEPVAPETPPAPDPVVYGTKTGERLLGDAGDDIVDGGAGDDRLIGGRGDDTLMGGSGDDTLKAGLGDDLLAGEEGDDLLYGRAGDDRLDGGAGNDMLRGGRGDDTLVGGEGHDNLIGWLGADDLSGGAGNDKLGAGAGDDLLAGGAGNDALRGGAGADRLDGGEGADTLTGGQGEDIFVFDDRSGVDVIEDFENGVDAIQFMIQSFGFDDLAILEEEDDVIIEHEGGAIRLKNVDAEDLDPGDFQFSGSG